MKIKIKKHLKHFTMDIDLSVSRAITILTGANGSGKTTLLRMVAGLETPDEGAIEAAEVFFDKNVNLPPEARNIGYLPQETSLFPWLTAEENILFGIKRKKLPAPSAWLEQLYLALEIGGIKRRMPKKLSGGEAQRVALARALAVRPSMLLLDEPFSSISMDSRPALRLFLKETQREWAVPVMVVTHDHAEASTLGDEIYELKEGKIIERREKGKLVRFPLVAY
jgi:molybdate transport system ATP-binding protein